MPFKHLAVKREYMRAYDKRLYAEDKDYFIKKNNRGRRRLSAYVRESKAGKSCIRCGEKDLVCLDFHHRNPLQKEIEIAKAPSLMVGLDRLKREIEKCDILCKNCHAKAHRDSVYAETEPLLVKRTSKFQSRKQEAHSL